jgi:hypothetical protein
MTTTKHYRKRGTAMFSIHHHPPTTLCEVFVDDEWQKFDGHGTTTEKSIEFYSIAYEPFASGSFPLRYNGVVAKNDSNPDSIFYKKKKG